MWVKLDLCCIWCVALQAEVSGYTVAWSATGRSRPSMWLGPIVCQRPKPAAVYRDGRWLGTLIVSGYRNIAQLMQKNEGGEGEQSCWSFFPAQSNLNWVWEFSWWQHRLLLVFFWGVGGYIPTQAHKHQCLVQANIYTLRPSNFSVTARVLIQCTSYSTFHCRSSSLKTTGGRLGVSLVL